MKTLNCIEPESFKQFDQRKHIIKTYSMILAILCSIFALVSFIQALQLLKARHAYLRTNQLLSGEEKKIALFHQKQKQLLQLENFQKHSNKIKQQEFIYQIIEALAQLQPKEMAFIAIKEHSKKMIELEGTASNIETVMKFIDDASKNDLLQRMEIKKIDQQAPDDKKAVHFVLNINEPHKRTKVHGSGE